MSSGRGGYRPGAGRKSSGTAEEWTTQRIKKATLDRLRTVADEAAMTVPELLDAFADYAERKPTMFAR